MQIYHAAARRREKYYTKQFSKVGKSGIGSGNGFSPVRNQTITKTNGDLLLLWEQISIKIHAQIFFLVNAFENVVCQMSTIFFWPQCDNGPWLLRVLTIFVMYIPSVNRIILFCLCQWTVLHVLNCCLSIHIKIPKLSNPKCWFLNITHNTVTATFSTTSLIGSRTCLPV